MSRDAHSGLAAVALYAPRLAMPVSVRVVKSEIADIVETLAGEQAAAAAEAGHSTRLQLNSLIMQARAHLGLGADGSGGV